MKHMKLYLNCQRSRRLIGCQMSSATCQWSRRMLGFIFMKLVNIPALLTWSSNTSICARWLEDCCWEGLQCLVECLCSRGRQTCLAAEQFSDGRSLIKDLRLLSSHCSKPSSAPSLSARDESGLTRDVDKLHRWAEHFAEVVFVVLMLWVVRQLLRHCLSLFCILRRVLMPR